MVQILGGAPELQNTCAWQWAMKEKRNPFFSKLLVNYVFAPSKKKKKKAKYVLESGCIVS